jgi:hypothetical protein
MKGIFTYTLPRAGGFLLGISYLWTEDVERERHGNWQCMEVAACILTREYHACITSTHIHQCVIIYIFPKPIEHWRVCGFSGIKRDKTKWEILDSRFCSAWVPIVTYSYHGCILKQVFPWNMSWTKTYLCPLSVAVNLSIQGRSLLIQRQRNNKHSWWWNGTEHRKQRFAHP